MFVRRRVGGGTPAKSQKSSERGAGGGGYGVIEEAAEADDSRELNSEDFKRPRSRKRSWRICVFLADLMNLRRAQCVKCNETRC